MPDPSISVVIPCHNAAAFIGDSLRSAAAQRPAPSQIVLVDDGSTDGSVQAARDTGVGFHLIHSNCKNAAATRNVGIAAATGEWVAFLDADDFWHDTHLASFAAEHGEGDVAWYALGERLEGGRSIPMGHQHQERHARSGLTARDALAVTARGIPFNTSGMIVRRARLEQVGGFDEIQRRRHDRELFLRVVSEGTWAFSAGRSWAYRVGHGGTVSSNEVECAYFHLRALVVNAERYAGPEMDRMLAAAARIAVGASMSGTRQQRRQALKMAWPYLPLPVRCAALAGVSCAPAYRAAAGLQRLLGGAPAGAAGGEPSQVAGGGLNGVAFAEKEA